jgi:hypothetical protein
MIGSIDYLSCPCIWFGIRQRNVTGSIPIGRYGGVQWNVVKRTPPPRISVRNSRRGSDDKKPPNVLLYELYIKETPEELRARISSLAFTFHFRGRRNLFVLVLKFQLPVNPLRDLLSWDVRRGFSRVTYG